MIIERRTKRGRVFYGCSRYPDCAWTSWKVAVPDPDGTCDGLIVQVSKDKTECVACGLKEKVAEPVEAVS